MKKNHASLIFSFILALLSLGCEKDIKYRTAINGEWVWVESVGGFGGWTLTPESENKTRRLIIDDFLYKEYVNDSLVLETLYDLGISEKSLVGTEERTFIELATGRKQAIVLRGSELELIDQCIDCFSHRYRRD